MATTDKLTPTAARALLAPAQVQAVDTWAERAQALRADVERLRIVDGESRDLAARLVVQMATGLKQAEDRRKELVAPHQAMVDALNLLFRTALDPIREADRMLREKLVADKRAQEAAAQAAREVAEAERRRADAAAAEARQRAEAAARAADRAPDSATYAAATQQRQEAEAEAKVHATMAAGVPVVPVAPVAKTTKVEGGGSVTVRTRWTYAVQEPALVPREYLAVDHSALRAAVDGGARSIPGVRIYEVDSTAVRTS